jgi:ABC-2 type transport system ATP-binding protein
VEIVVEELTKVYEGRIHALGIPDLRIGEGVFGLLGPNGSGKTTFMRILATLLQPTTGRATIDGHDVVRDRQAVRAMLGYMPQEFGFYPALQVWEVLDYVALLYGLSDRAKRREAVEWALEAANLVDVRDRRVSALSGGMKQRLGIAQSVLNSPQLLIVDEPTSGLDPQERVRVRSLLAELAGERTVILSTHIVADVAAAADVIAILYEGQVLFAGSPEELLHTLAGQTWQILVDRERLGQLKANYLVSGVFRAPGQVQVRLVTDHPPADAEPATPTMEDAYIALMARSTGSGGA